MIVSTDPQNRFLLVDDNSVFQLHVYAIDATTGAVNEVKPSPYETKIQPGRMIVDPLPGHTSISFARGQA